MTEPMTDARLEEIRVYLAESRPAAIRTRRELSLMAEELLAAIDRRRDTVRELNEIAGKLKVTPDPRQGQLLVDASDVMHTGHDVQLWFLKLGDPDGREWVHSQSGERGPLAPLLRSIAACYLLAPDGREVRRYG